MSVYILKLNSSNWQSVEKALHNTEYHPMAIEIRDILELNKNSIVIIPGVGNINSLCNEIKSNIGINHLRDFINRHNIRVIGICLGFQFLLDSGSIDSLQVLSMTLFLVEVMHN